MRAMDEALQGLYSKKRVLHISDVHVRPLARHEEYREIFEVVYGYVQQTLEDEKESEDPGDVLIVFTGDLFDSKTKFCPETILVCREFLKQLGKLAPTFVIAGNHDMLESNVSRLDAITPIAQDLTNVFYLRETGVYASKDKTFALVVNSLYDQTTPWITAARAKEELGSTKPAFLAALYHGTVAGSVNAHGFEFTNSADDGTTTRMRTMKDFEGFDAVLLGDIHKMQVISEEKPVAAYAGSLIQQNHGEKLGDHGFLDWVFYTKPPLEGDESWDKCDVPDFVAAPNDYGFVDIICEDGKWANMDAFDLSSSSEEEDDDASATRSMPPTSSTSADDEKEAAILEEKDPLPPHCYARFFLKNTTSLQLDVIVQTVKQYVETLVITKKNFAATSVATTDVSVPSTTTEEQQQRLDEDTLIKDYCSQNELDFEQMLALHNSYRKAIGKKEEDDDSVSSSYVWKPIFMELRNMFGYGGNVTNMVAFPEHGVMSVVAGNAYGKTSLVNCLLFALFGRAPLNPGANMNTVSVVHGKETNAFVRLLVNHGGRFFLIERKANPAKKKTASNGLDKFEFSCDVWESDELGAKLAKRTSVKKNNTDAFVTSLFGTIDTFLLNNLVNKESSRDLLSLTPAEQVKALKRNFCVDVYDKYRELNKAAMDKAKREFLDASAAVKGARELIEQQRQQQQGEDVVEKQNIVVDDETLAVEQAKLGQMEQQLRQLLIDQAGVDKDRIQLNKLKRELEAFNKDLDVMLAGKTEDYEPGETDGTRELLLQRQATLNRLKEKLRIISTFIDDCKFDREHMKALGSIAARRDVDDINPVCDKDEGTIFAEIKQLLSARGSLQTTATADIDTIEEGTDYEALYDEQRAQVERLGFGLYEPSSEEIADATAVLNQHEKRKHEEPARVQELLEAEQEALARFRAENSRLLATSTGSSVDDVSYDELSARLEKLKSRRRIRTLQSTGEPLLVSDYDELLDACETQVAIAPKKAMPSVVLSELKPAKHYAVLPEVVFDSLCTIVENIEYDEKRKVTVVDEDNFYDDPELEKEIKQLQVTMAHSRERGLQQMVSELKEQLEEATKHQQALPRAEKLINEYLPAYAQLKKTEMLKAAAKLQHIDQHELPVTCLPLLSEEESLQTRVQDLEKDVQELEAELKICEAYDKSDSFHDAIDELEAKVGTDQAAKLREVEEEVTNQRMYVKDLEKRAMEAKQWEREREAKEKQEQVVEELLERANKAEQALMPLKHYSNLIGSKGIPTRLMFERVADLQGYVNSILERFTKYSMVISYKDTGDACSFMLRNRETGVLLSACRLSGYEKLTIQLALKRALNKFSYMTKSSIMIIDEAFDCIDVSNFDSMLPEAVNLITEDYSVCLAISQRDISHISDLRCTISREDGKSVISCGA